MKILIDARPELDIIVTGSASFDLLNKIGEPLTGRQVPVNLFPISIQELQTNLNSFEIKNNINEYLLYGMYPEVITANNSESKKFILDELVQGYLLKDALELEKVKSPKILHDLLKLLAFQIGKEVSHTELANSLKIDQKTVSRYIDILEKCFIIYNLRGFNRNLRSEVTKMSRYYFYDVGIRNSLINNFNSVDLRNDIGELWENFYFMERLKSIKYKQDFRNLYFWRTWEQNEIDLIEEVDGTLNAFEIKWNAKKRVKIPKLWQENYSANSTFTVITPENFLDFL